MKSTMLESKGIIMNNKNIIQVDWSMTDKINYQLSRQGENKPFIEVFPFWDENIDKVKNIYNENDLFPRRFRECIDENHEWYENKVYVYYKNNTRYVSRYISTQDEDGNVFNIGEGELLYPE